MTLRGLYEKGTKVLESTGIEEAGLDSWYLLEHVTRISRAAYLADPDKSTDPEAEERYLDLIRKRSMRVPLQHLTGVQEFMGLEFAVNEHVLIPRQDTEVLVEEALEVVKRENRAGSGRSVTEKYRILDMCTGSGCILLSLLYYGRKYMQSSSGVNALEGTGVDISSPALETAQKNGKQLHIEAIFSESDLFENVDGRYDMIVSNPPYIRTDVIQTLQDEVRKFDPILALDGKEDGLFFYRNIIDKSREHLEKGGHLLFEIGHDQAEAVTQMMIEAGFADVKMKKDLAGLDRVVAGVYDKTINRKGL